MPRAEPLLSPAALHMIFENPSWHSLRRARLAGRVRCPQRPSFSFAMPIMSEGTGDEENVIGYCLTFTCFRVTFQVFIPFVTGDLAPLEDFTEASCRSGHRW
jgi:hypothetical protein